MWLLDSRKSVGSKHCDLMASLYKHIEGQAVDYIKIESENQKSSLIILLVLFHSACPYKNYCLKCFAELQTLFIYFFKFFFFLLSNKGP